jgi:hypothetical protein
MGSGAIGEITNGDTSSTSVGYPATMPLGVAVVAGTVDVDDPDSLLDDVHAAATTAVATTAATRAAARGTGRRHPGRRRRPPRLSPHTDRGHLGCSIVGQYRGERSGWTMPIGNPDADGSFDSGNDTATGR